MTKSNDELKACCAHLTLKYETVQAENGYVTGKWFCQCCHNVFNITRANVTPTDGDSYTPDQERVAKFLFDETGIGGGDDPIGFIIASHRELARQRNAPTDGDAERALELICKYAQAYYTIPPISPAMFQDAVDVVKAALQSTRKPDDVTVSDMAGWIRLLLPLAKGYVHANPGIRSTENIIEDAENCLASLDAVLSEGK